MYTVYTVHSVIVFSVHNNCEVETVAKLTDPHTIAVIHTHTHILFTSLATTKNYRSKKMTYFLPLKASRILQVLVAAIKYTCIYLAHGHHLPTTDTEYGT